MPTSTYAAIIIENSMCAARDRRPFVSSLIMYQVAILLKKTFSARHNTTERVTQKEISNFAGYIKACFQQRQKHRMIHTTSLQDIPIAFGLIQFYSEIR